MTTMAAWIAYPYDNAAYRFDAVALARHWAVLHAGDAEPLPGDPRLLAAWTLFHAGEFEQAMHAGLQAAAQGAVGGTTVANKAQLVYAAYLEPVERVRIALCQEVARRAQVQIARAPEQANAHHDHGVALARSTQSLSLHQTLARGAASRIKAALEAALRLAPTHADAHLALGAFHAEMVDKMGSLLGRTQGVSKDEGFRLVREGLRLNPSSPLARLSAADTLMLLEGEQRLVEAERLYSEAASSMPLDAVQRLGTELARAELED